MNDLMELINECEVAKQKDLSKRDSANSTANVLEELGFKAASTRLREKIAPMLKEANIAAAGYIAITPEKIQAFLKRKVAEYEAQKVAKKKDADYWAAIAQNVRGVATAAQINNFWTQYVSSITLSGSTLATFGSSTFSESTSGGKIDSFEWSEASIENYAGIPPMNVLAKFREEKAKNLFDYFCIASVNAVKDPLLLGRVNGSSTRYFIAQWGDDVKLDDVI